MELHTAKLTQIMLFRYLWNNTPKKSFVSGLWLREYEGTELWLSIFAHVLAKGENKYPYFKWYAKNIALLTPFEHHLHDNGTEEQRINYSLDIEEKSGGKNTADWGKLKRLEEELKQEYKKYFPTTKGLIIGYKYDPDEVKEIVGRLNVEFWNEIKEKTRM